MSLFGTIGRNLRNTTSPSFLRSIFRHVYEKPCNSMIYCRKLSDDHEYKEITQNRIKKAAYGGTTISYSMSPNALMFKIERVWAAGMIPVLPAAYFIHSPIMDFALAFIIVMHSHWGMMAVVEDYARPLVIGKTLANIALWSVYVFTIIIMAGLLKFNIYDVGLTKAFEKAFSL